MLLQKILLFLKFSFFAFCFKYLGSAFINMKFILIEASFPSYFAFSILPFCYWFATELFQSQLWNLVAGTFALSLFSGCLAGCLASWMTDWLTLLLTYLLTYIHTNILVTVGMVPAKLGFYWDVWDCRQTRFYFWISSFEKLNTQTLNFNGTCNERFNVKTLKKNSLTFTDWTLKQETLRVVKIVMICSTLASLWKIQYFWRLKYNWDEHLWQSLYWENSNPFSMFTKNLHRKCSLWF